MKKGKVLRRLHQVKIKKAESTEKRTKIIKITKAQRVVEQTIALNLSTVKPMSSTENIIKIASNCNK